MLVDPQCTALGIPDHLHTCKQAEDQEFEPTERLYRRHKLDDNKIKTAITFNRMSVNRAKYCPNVGDILINSKDGTRYEGFGVVAFTVKSVQSLQFSPEAASGKSDTVYDAVVRHDIAKEPCNFSHTRVNGRQNGSEISEGSDLGNKTVRKELRHQIFQSVIKVIPVEQAGQNLEPRSWE